MKNNEMCYYSMIVIGFIAAYSFINYGPSVNDKLDLILERLNTIQYQITMDKPYEKEVK